MLLKQVPAFTYIEMLFVLSIISILLIIQMSVPWQKEVYASDEYTLNRLISQFNYYKAKAIKEEQTIILLFLKGKGHIQIKQQDGKKVAPISLNKGHINPKTNVRYISFDKMGHINQFGSLYLSFHDRQYRIIFYIEKGRLRYEKV